MPSLTRENINNKIEIDLNSRNDNWDAIEAESANHETRITNNEVAIADHETRISANETAITDHETRISANEVEIAELQDSKVVEHNLDTAGPAYFIRYANGKQVCWEQYTESISWLIVASPIHRSSITGRTFPRAFLGNPIVRHYVQMGEVWASAIRTVTNTDFTALGYSYLNIATATRTLYYIATGRWV